jgi:hypothetical protein
MFVIVLLSLFCITDDKLSLLSGDYQDLLGEPLEEMDMWINDKELFEELQESPGKCTSEKLQQSSADASKAWGKCHRDWRKSLHPEIIMSWVSPL